MLLSAHDDAHIKKNNAQSSEKPLSTNYQIVKLREGRVTLLSSITQSVID